MSELDPKNGPGFGLGVHGMPMPNDHLMQSRSGYTEGKPQRSQSNFGPIQRPQNARGGQGHKVSGPSNLASKRPMGESSVKQHLPTSGALVRQPIIAAVDTNNLVPASASAPSTVDKQTAENTTKNAKAKQIPAKATGAFKKSANHMGEKNDIKSKNVTIEIIVQLDGVYQQLFKNGSAATVEVTYATILAGLRKKLKIKTRGEDVNHNGDTWDPSKNMVTKCSLGDRGSSFLKPLYLVIKPRSGPGPHPQPDPSTLDHLLNQTSVVSNKDVMTDGVCDILIQNQPKQNQKILYDRSGFVTSDSVVAMSKQNNYDPIDSIKHSNITAGHLRRIGVDETSAFYKFLVEPANVRRWEINFSPDDVRPVHDDRLNPGERISYFGVHFLAQALSDYRSAMSEFFQVETFQHGLVFEFHVGHKYPCDSVSGVQGPIAVDRNTLVDSCGLCYVTLLIEVCVPAVLPREAQPTAQAQEKPISAVWEELMRAQEKPTNLIDTKLVDVK